jgi:hypothetical protein
MRWLPIPNSSRHDPVRVVQQALSASPQAGLDTLLDGLDAILGQVLWQVGGKFDTFAEFAIAQQPGGLGVRSLPPLKLLRYALLANSHFASWTELLERVAREPGRPPKKLVNDEGFERFYTVPTATTARDRLLLGLKRHHPEHFAAVCALDCSPREAAIRAGLIKAGPSLYGGACNIVAAASLKERAQGRLLCDLFNVLSPNAQCTLIARVLEPRLGFGLAERWRNIETP